VRGSSVEVELSSGVECSPIFQKVFIEAGSRPGNPSSSPRFAGLSAYFSLFLRLSPFRKVG
jgi:hypothetical protein